MNRGFSRLVALSLCALLSFLLAALAGGCSWVPALGAGRHEPRFSQKELSEPYDQITLNTSLTIDALPKIQRFQSDRGPLLGGVETLVEAGDRVATVGQSEDGRRTWFNMVVFDEFKLNVIRKYFFIEDEQASRFAILPGKGMRFDCQTVLGKDVLEASYHSENAKRIAIFKVISQNLRNDVDAFSAGTDSSNEDNKTLSVCGMLVSQTLDLILVKLESSAVLAMRLSSTEGVVFDQTNFGPGKVWMVVRNNAAAVALRFGAFRTQKIGLGSK
ncbi:MAG: hypothetical protein P8Z79_08655 [Sedimentisphaerales bacterium]